MKLLMFLATFLLSSSLFAADCTKEQAKSQFSGHVNKLKKVERTA